MSSAIPQIIDECKRTRQQSRQIPGHPVYAELCARMAERASEINRPLATASISGVMTPDAHTALSAALQHTKFVQHNNEDLLPLPPESVNAAFSVCSLHTVNDMVGSFIQLRMALQPDGVLIASLPGARTLQELRQVLGETEIARSGGISPRVLPFPDIRDIGNVVGRAGFALPVIDSEMITLTYPNLTALMHDVRSLGQGNMLHGMRNNFTARGFFADAETRYRTQFSDIDGRLVATFELLTITAWKPHQSQPKPAKRGSGTTPFSAFS
jgi:SAM-dependent methyltransferase